MTVPVAVHEAALGADVEVPTLDEPVKVKIPPGTASGTRLRVVAGARVGAAAEAGDLVVDVQIVLPPIKDEQSLELLREFGQLNDVDVRKHLFG